MKLVSRGHTEGFYYKPRIDFSMLEEHHEGLVAMTACAGGIISPHLISGDYDKAKRIATKFKNLFEDDFYIEIQDHGLNYEVKVRESAPKLAAELGIKLVATNDCHYIEQRHAIAHNVLLLIRDANSKEPPNVNVLKYGTDQNYFRSGAEMHKLFSEWPESIESTLEIEEKCNVSCFLERFQNAGVPDSGRERNYYSGCLSRTSHEQRTCRRFPAMTREIEDRSNFELNVINKMGYAGYFLIVQDFIAAARPGE